MSTEKMRAEFEKFRDERNAALESEGHKPGSKWHVTNAHYPTWQASRAAIEVELPIPKEACGPDGSYMEYFEPEQIERAIESLGLKVKP